MASPDCPRCEGTGFVVQEEDDGRLSTALRCECARQGKYRLKMVLPPELPVRELFRIAEGQGVQVRHLDYKKDSLQDIFLKAMGDDNGRL